VTFRRNQSRTESLYSEDRTGNFFLNISKFLPNYATLHTTKRQSSHSPLWQSKISHVFCLFEIEYTYWTSCDINQFWKRERERERDEIIPTPKVQYALVFISQPKQNVTQPARTLRPWLINRTKSFIETCSDYITLAFVETQLRVYFPGLLKIPVPYMCFVSLKEISIKHYRLSTFRRLDYWLIQVKHSYRKVCDLQLIMRNHSLGTSGWVQLYSICGNQVYYRRVRSKLTLPQ
jgi:hypothetical protein